MPYSVIIEDVSRETFSAINEAFVNGKDSYDIYADRLLWWNKKVNLISRDSKRQDVLNHIKHSLWVSASSEWLSCGNSIVDAGTGGGLPGMPLALAFPENKYHLNDIVHKKILAVREIVRDLGVGDRVGVEAESISDHKPNPESVLVTKHAFKINDLMQMISGKSYRAIIMLKGSDYQEELHLLKSSVEVRVVEIDSYEPDPFFEGKRVVTIIPNE